MSTLYADLGETGLLNVGYTFKDSSEVAIGSRITAGITEKSGGWYKASNVTVPSTAESIWWDDSVVTQAAAREYFSSHASSPVIPTDPDYCVITGYLRNLRTGLLLRNHTIRAVKVPGGMALLGGAFIVGGEKSAISDDSGYFELRVEKNSEITPADSEWRIICNEAGIDYQAAFEDDTFDLRTIVT